MKTTKTENLKNYLMDRCTDMAEDYNMKEPTNFEEARGMIQHIFETEKPRKYNTYRGRYETFIDWIFGLCFCSPIMTDLTPYTNYKTPLIQENDVATRIYNLIY